MWWFLLIFVVLLKIPMVYLGYVVWWAVKDPPLPGEGHAGAGGLGGDGDPPSGRSWWKPPLPGRTPRRGPHGSPARRPRTALTRAQQKETA